MKVFIAAPYAPIHQGWFVALLLAYPSLHQVTTTTPETCYNSISFSFGGLVCFTIYRIPTRQNRNNNNNHNATV